MVAARRMTFVTPGVGGISPATQTTEPAAIKTAIANFQLA
jgi:hypothetical protein